MSETLNQQQDVFSTNSNYALFVGKNFHYYLPKWKILLKNKCNGNIEKLQKGGINQISFNFWAFLLTYIWDFYRKMYLRGLLSLSAIIVAPLLIAPFFQYIMYPLLMIVYGMYANRRYFAFVDKKIVKIKTRSQDPDFLKYKLTKAGGTSILAACLPVVIILFMGSLVLIGQNPDYKSQTHKISSNEVSPSMKKSIERIKLRIDYNDTDTTVQDVVARLARGDGEIEWQKDNNNYYILIKHGSITDYLKFAHNQNTGYIMLAEVRIRSRVCKDPSILECLI